MTDDECVSQIVNSLVIIFKNEEGGLTCAIHPDENYKPSVYGVIVNDLVQHIANCFGVREAEVWKWIDDERFHPNRGKVQQLPDASWKDVLR